MNFERWFLVILFLISWYWFPQVILRLRTWIFHRVNGKEGLMVPGPNISIEYFKTLYEHPGMRGRSRGAGLSDLFWYWLSPGPHLHQEHLEEGELYNDVAKMTRMILAKGSKNIDDIVAKNFRTHLSRDPVGRFRLVRLRDWLMPLWARVYYELVFDSECPLDDEIKIVNNAKNVVNALKFVEFRNMKPRKLLTDSIEAKIINGECPHSLPKRLSSREQALVLHGVFFTTAVVQMSEASAHLLLNLAKYEGIQDEVRSNNLSIRREKLGNLIKETFRMSPLFGIAHRISSQAIQLADGQIFPRGTVFCFNYEKYHRSLSLDSKIFKPERWVGTSEKQMGTISFGVSKNRSCPAQSIASNSLKHLLELVCQNFHLISRASHSRSLPGRGFVLLTKVKSSTLSKESSLLRWVGQFATFTIDRFEERPRSLVQLFKGTLMVIHANHLKLCKNYFSKSQKQSGEQYPSFRGDTLGDNVYGKFTVSKPKH